MRTLFVLAICISVGFQALAQHIPKRIRRNFTTCFSEVPTSIRTVLNIDGYYIVKHVGKRSVYSGAARKTYDSILMYMLLYEDGSVLYNFFPKRPDTNVEAYLKKLWAGASTTNFNNWGHWGAYRINSDTLTIQTIFNKSLLSPWPTWERKFRIIDRNRLEGIMRVDLEGKRNAPDPYKKDELTCRFVLFPYIPSNNTWFKKFDWMWCNNKGPSR